ncbi:hypothetical protein EB796_017468 [Bugula neritina]|uniref:Uncharacterized protein n=1 Tax=Bugula neritina TaxID=10212 RepID=A0A7J7JF41_BUGNE|nr:hypothetical protein EB796_017468 [Bugula neritina]
MQDWCKLDYEGGCKNNGICYNQCDTFWCDCPRPKDYDYYGKRLHTAQHTSKHKHVAQHFIGKSVFPVAHFNSSS